MSEQGRVEESRDLPEWTEDDIIFFPSGIPGFEDSKRFIIISVQDYEPFHWLQCIEGSKIHFAIINPLIFQKDYNPKISKAELDTLEINNSCDLLMYVIVTLRSPLAESSANLMGPIFINLGKRIGKQIIIEDNSYSVREKIIT